MLSPIDLKETNRDLSRKLDELYKSYESKEKLFENQKNSLQLLVSEDEPKTSTPMRRVNDFFKQIRI